MIGQTVSHYRILEKLGEGGMGEVYLAEDTSLERKVALKFLPASLQENDIAHKRFIREAKSAAALDHPFICKIYEAGEAEGHSFIAMEYVEGQTVGERLAQGPLPLREALLIGVEIAQALEKAHSSGIVHRDLKPANIMLTPDGHAKVMDFGLAKKVISGDKSESDITLALTREGSTIGTLTYMSPEQLKAQPLDARSDIFSFGIVLYEILTGMHPFRKQTPTEMVGSILRDDHPPIGDRIEDPPEILQQTLRKMLAKDSGRRYQSIHEVNTNLESLLIEPSQQRRVEAFRRTISPVLIPAGGALVLMILAVVLYLLYDTGPEPTDQQVYISEILTSYEGREHSPAVSPDGQQVAFAWAEESDYRESDIFLLQIGDSRPHRLIETPDRRRAPAWSPDGSKIAFIARSDVGPNCALMVASTDGTNVRRVADCSCSRKSRPSWAPGGEEIAFLSDNSIWLASTETSVTRQLTSPPPSHFDLSPAISPDGRYLAFERAFSSWSRDIFVQELDAALEPVGEPRQITQLGYDVAHPTWVGSELVFSHGPLLSERLWKIVPGSEGPPQPLAISDTGVNASSYSEHSKRLVYSRLRVEANIYSTPLDDPGGASRPDTKVVSSTQYDWQPNFSPDGNRIAFVSNRSGSHELWVCDANGANLEKWTDLNGPSAGSPAWSPDGKRIAFDSRIGGEPQIYVIEGLGAEPRPVTGGGAHKGLASWSNDGQWIYFQSNRGGQWDVWKVPLEGTQEPDPVVGQASRVVKSHDGSALFFSRSGTIWKVLIDDLGHEEVVTQLAGAILLASEKGIYYTHSTPFGFAISFHDFETGSSTLLRRINVQIWRYPVCTLSPDAKTILYTKVEHNNEDLMLVENFR